MTETEKRRTLVNGHVSSLRMEFFFPMLFFLSLNNVVSCFYTVKAWRWVVMALSLVYLVEQAAVSLGILGAKKPDHVGTIQIRSWTEICRRRGGRRCKRRVHLNKARISEISGDLGDIYGTMSCFGNRIAITNIVLESRTCGVRFACTRSMAKAFWPDLVSLKFAEMFGRVKVSR